MNTTTGKINVGDLFKKTLATALSIAGKAIIQTGSQIPAVQKQIEVAKTTAGKNILWKYFPIAILVGMGIFMVSKVK